MFRLKLYKVEGRSMRPDFLPGDVVLGIRLPFMRYLKGTTIVVNHPKYQKIIKDICEVLPSGDVKLSGRDPRSTSTEELGIIKKEWIEAKMLYHFRAD